MKTLPTMKSLVTTAACATALLAPNPADAQTWPLPADSLEEWAASASDLDEDGLTRVSAASTIRCPAAVVIVAAALFLEQPDDLGVRFTLHGGDFAAFAAVDAEDPRDGIVDTDWVSASWSSPSGILWGRDYAPDNVFEGIVRLLDNRQARINAYTLSFAPLTPRLIVHAIGHASTEDTWVLLTVNGVAVGFPWAGAEEELGWPLCADGVFFVGDAFDARGFIPNKYLQ